MADIYGRYDILSHDMKRPSAPVCMTCNSVMSVEFRRLQLNNMRNALIIQELKFENEYLEKTLALEKKFSSMRRIISMMLLVSTAFFTFADKMPDLPRRIPRGRRREEQAA